MIGTQVAGKEKKDVTSVLASGTADKCPLAQKSILVAAFQGPSALVMRAILWPPPKLET